MGYIISVFIFDTVCFIAPTLRRESYKNVSD